MFHLKGIKSSHKPFTNQSDILKIWGKNASENISGKEGNAVN